MSTNWIERLHAMETPTDAEMAFGSTAHLPPREEFPDNFWAMTTPECEFLSQRFFHGWTQADLDRVEPKPGISDHEAVKGFRIIHSIMKSFEPKHEHKIGGCGFLFSQWFNLKPEEQA